MKLSPWLAMFGAFSVLTVTAQEVQQPDPRKPEWAYAVAPGAGIAGARRGGGGPGGPGGGAPGARAGAPGAPGAPNGGGGGRGTPDPTLFTLPGSKFQFARSQVSNGFGPADWFPEDHPAMPEIVSHGHAPDARACGFCHMPNGKGRPENAPVAGQPKDYIVRQLLEFKSGARKTAEPRKPNDMGNIAPFLTDKDVDDAATYFSSMPWTQWIRVVETDTVKKTRVAGQMFHLVDDGTTEPIGNRIVEAPENEAEEQLRAPRTGFVAYVPVGAVKRGEVLVQTGGNGKTTACVTCHGPDLRGLGGIPALANRSPSYMARQIYDFEQGTRNGSMAPLMKAVVEKLTVEDLVNIFAYTASLKP